MPRANPHRILPNPQLPGAYRNDPSNVTIGNMGLRFEWHETKASANLRKHRVAFEEAKTVFGDPLSLVIQDVAHSADEERWVRLGISARLDCWPSLILNAVRSSGLSAAAALPLGRKPIMSKRTIGLKTGNGMKAQYDFSKGKRTDHAKQYTQGHEVRIEKADGSTTVQHFSLEDGAVLLEPDVRAVFKDSNAVNQALRCLIPLLRPPG